MVIGKNILVNMATNRVAILNKMYHFITNRWQIESMSEDKVRAILTLMPMGGIQLDGKRLVVHENVEVVDMALQE